MELQAISPNGVMPSQTVEEVNDVKFIESNTIPIALQEIKDKHLVPVFVKDNQPTISQADFIQSTKDIVEELSGKNTANLAVRVSHPIKGRTFQARKKKAAELLEHEKTIYYSRCAFAFEIPDIYDEVYGQRVTLSVVGVKSYNMDNLYSFGGSLQRFKVGIGYKVKVCTNMCLWTDGTSLDIKVRSLDELNDAIYELIDSSNFVDQIAALNQLGDYELSEKQFAKFLGRARMYNHLPKDMRKDIPPLLISDSQISTVTKAYYADDNFRKNSDGSINLWNMYNLLTDSVKSSYIDKFLDRNVNAYEFTKGIANSLDGKSEYNWFLN